MKHLFIRLLFAFAASALAAATLHAASSARDARKKIVMLIAEHEYETATSLPPFAAQHLKDFRVAVVTGSLAPGEVAMDPIKEVADADVLLVSVRRRTLPKAQLDLIRKHVAAGKSVVGIRTASHAFALSKNQKLAPGNSEWPEFDAEVLGGNYVGHHGKDTITHVTLSPVADNKHPILRGVKLPFKSDATLYKTNPLRPGATPLLTGTIPGVPPEPLAWAFKRKDGGKSFYISLGGPSDFKNPEFVKVLRNALTWAAQ